MAFKTVESLDTNIILRIALGDIPQQCLKAQDLLLRQNVTFYVPDLAITEAVYVMQKDYSRTEIVEKLSRILELPRIMANFDLFQQVFPMYLEHPQLSFNDCCLTTYAALNEAEPLWTFDRDLAKKSPTAKLLD